MLCPVKRGEQIHHTLLWEEKANWEITLASTVIPQYPQGTGSRIPKDEKNLPYSSPLCYYKVVYHFHVMYAHPLVHFKSSLDYLQYLIQCKCYTNSRLLVANASFAFWNFLGFFFPWNIFNLWLVECGLGNLQSTAECRLFCEGNWLNRVRKLVMLTCGVRIYWNSVFWIKHEKARSMTGINREKEAENNHGGFQSTCHGGVWESGVLYRPPRHIYCEWWCVYRLKDEKSDTIDSKFIRTFCERAWSCYRHLLLKQALLICTFLIL